MASKEIRCFKEDALMVPVSDDGTRIKCTACGFTTTLIDYDAEAIRKDFEAGIWGRSEPTDEDYAQDPNDGAEHPWGHFAPKVRPKTTYRDRPEVPEPGEVKKYKLDA